MKNLNLITTFNYKCLNSSQCGNKGLIQVSKLRSEQDTDEFCSVCNTKLKLVGEVYNCIATFGSKTPEQKKEIIKKRAKEHDRKKMNDRVHEVRKRIINNSLR